MRACMWAGVDMCTVCLWESESLCVCEECMCVPGGGVCSVHVSICESEILWEWGGDVCD